MPWTFGTMTVGLLALVGVFPLVGFFSKESILVAAEHAAQGDAVVAAWVGWLVLAISTLTIAVTAAYATRTGVLTWFGDRRGKASAHEGPAVMTVPLVVLAVPTIGFGVLILRREWLPTWILPKATEPLQVAGGLTPQLDTVAISALAIVVGAVTWVVVRNALTRWLPEGGLAARGFGVDWVYDLLAVRPYLWLVRRVAAFDRRVITRTVAEIGSGTQIVGAGIQRQHRGDVQRYISAAVTSVVVVMVLLLVAVAT
jgi:NADH-quinone oxidoreductase subunit L